MKPDQRWPGLWLVAVCAATGCFPAGRAAPDSRSPLPDCDAPDNPSERVWCAELPPDPVSELPRLRAALARMTARGGSCRRLAGMIAGFLARGAVHLYDPGEYPAAGAVAPVDGGRSYLLLSRDLVLRYFDAAHRSANLDSRGVPRPETLQLVLAHEADHLLGLGHVDVDGFLTPHALRCSDLR